MNERVPGEYGKLIDRGKPVSFRFEGRDFVGYDGDTLSSALWANGVRVLGRSFKYHRARGIWGFSNIDCNNIAEHESETNIRADLYPISEGLVVDAVNTQGGVANDRLRHLGKFSRFTPVGFYYKAFHTPRWLFPFYENRIRQIAGLGRVNTETPIRHTPKDYAFCDVLVVGAGPAGLSASISAARSGAAVLLVDENPILGGTLLHQLAGDSGAQRYLEESVRKARQQKNVEVRTGTTAVGCYADGWVGLVDGVRLTKLRAKTTILATGCYEQPAVFHNNDLPSVMMASAAQRLLHLYAVKPFEKGVAVVANPEGYRAVLDLMEAGVQIPVVSDLRAEEEPNELLEEVQNAGVEVLKGWALFEANAKPGQRGLNSVTLAPLNGEGQAQPEAGHTIDCDGVITSVGWAPADGLLRQAGGTMTYDSSIEQFIPSQLPKGYFVAGRLNGFYDLGAQIEDGQRNGLEAAALLGFTEKPQSAPLRRETSSPNHPYPVFPHPKGKEFVDLDEDLQIKDFENAVQEGYDSVELLKRYTTVGMGPSQGKHSNLLAARILARCRGEDMEGRELTTARPFITPVPLSHLAGRTFTPRRRTPIHIRHEEAPAKFMFAGNWLRPEYYPQNGASREECIIKEAENVRENVGLIDLGTLGKLEIFGPDAVEFIERIYTGKFTKLRTGMTRYGLACDETGVVIDDGIVARLGEDRFYVSTTTTSSDDVYRNLQRWAIQWRSRVTIVNVTDHYAAMNLAGPRSFETFRPLTDIDLDPTQFPYLGIREGKVAGAPARVCRVGFVGEMGYEIHVPWDTAIGVWDAIVESGESHQIRPFGVEAQRLLRLEKGHIIVGQDTDALSDPFEAGSGWAVKMDKPFFVGQRSLRILRAKPPKRQLVGWALPKGHSKPIPKECHLVVDAGDIAGRVTSVGSSPTCECVIGLAYVRPDRAEPGTKIEIRVDGGVMVEVTVSELPFYDREGARQKFESNTTEVT